MRIETSLLLSKVGKRIVLLFALCALLPILAIAVGSFYRVARELQTQGEQDLKQKSKDHAMGIAERLTFLDEELHNLGESVLDVRRSQLALEEDWQRILEGRFFGFALQRPEGAIEQLWGEPVAPPPLDEEMERQLFEKQLSVIVFPEEGEYGTLVLARAVFPRNMPAELGDEQPAAPVGDAPVGDAGTTDAEATREAAGPWVAWGALEPSYLWFGREGGNRDTLVEEEIQMWVLDPQRRFLYSLTPHPVTVPEPIAHSLDQTVPTPAEWTDDGETWISHYFTLSLGFGYLEPHLTVVMSQAKSTLLEPITYLRYTLLLITLASLWVVLLLSLSQIRKSLIPLERLREGTRRIAERDFSTRVKITSGDEFEELGESFNWMVSRLGQQFSTLQALHRIAGAGLGSADSEALGIGVLENLGTTFGQRARSLTVLDEGSSGRGFTYFSAAGTDERPRGTATTLSEEERAIFGDNRAPLTLVGERAEQAFLLPLLEAGEKGPFLALPVHLRSELAAILSVAFRGKPPNDVDSMRQLRQIAEQVGAALAHVRLFMHVQNLYRGTLKALARTIDAKSKWTLGHSERVTRMAIRLARQLGLPETEIQVIDRGGQLHDIGKIGVPSALLDKPGALTPEERKKVEAHTTIGERILEPIPGFEDIIPMVGQHHEWFDGGGYPRGLRGTDIHWYARILAVADTYDALRSDRPYRGAIVREDVVGYIVSRSGTQFDPQVIDAFVKVVPARAQERAASPVMYL